MIRKIATQAAKLAVTALLLWLLLRKVDITAAWHAAQGISTVSIIEAVALLVIQLGVCGLRWQLVVKALGAHLGWWKATSVFAVGMFFGIALPGAVGGDVVRMWTTRRAGLSLAASVNSVILERVATVFALVLLVAASEPLWADRAPGGADLWAFPAMLVLGIVGTAIVMRLDKLPASLTRWRTVRAVTKLAADTRRVYLDARHAIPVLIAALIGHINLGLIGFVLARGMGVDIGLTDAVFLFLPAVLAATLPISVAGFGPREGALILFYGIAGVPEAQATAISFLYGVMSIGLALTGGLFWLTMADRRTTPTAAEMAENEKV